MHGLSASDNSYVPSRTPVNFSMIFLRMNAGDKNDTSQGQWWITNLGRSREYYRGILSTVYSDFRWSILFWLALSSAFGASRTNAKAQDYSDYSNFEIIERASPQAPTSLGGNGRVQTAYSGVQCYSCMSVVYGGLWDPVGYDKIYQRPGKGFGFTAHCKEPSEKPDDVPRIDCPQDNCVTLIETLKIGYGKVGYIRGCYNSVFKWGFNKTGVSGRLKYRDFCHRFNLTDLAAGQNYRHLHNNELHVCSCRGHLCNGAVSTPNSASSSLLQLVIVTAVTVLLAVLSKD